MNRSRASERSGRAIPAPAGRILVGACLALAGCRADLNQQLLERELRMQEDQIYRLQDELASHNARLESALGENTSLRRQLGIVDAAPRPARSSSAPTFVPPPRLPSLPPRLPRPFLLSSTAPASRPPAPRALPPGTAAPAPSRSSGSRCSSSPPRSCGAPGRRPEPRSLRPPRLGLETGLLRLSPSLPPPPSPPPLWPSRRPPRPPRPLPPRSPPPRPLLALPASPPRPPPRPADDCSPPYVIRDGIKHYKRSCFR